MLECSTGSHCSSNIDLPGGYHLGMNGKLLLRPKMADLSGS